MARIWIALLRGINVGGKNRLAMAALRQSLERAGFDDVQTLIQSGNIVFKTGEGTARAVTRTIQDVLHQDYDIDARVMVLSKSHLKKIMDACPFDIEGIEPKTLHVFVMDSRPRKPDLEWIEQMAVPSEQWSCVDRQFYLLAPDGIGRSKLAAGVEKKLGVPTTARNWNTLNRLAEMAGL